MRIKRINAKFWLVLELLGRRPQASWIKKQWWLKLIGVCTWKLLPNFLIVLVLVRVWDKSILAKKKSHYFWKYSLISLPITSAPSQVMVLTQKEIKKINIWLKDNIYGCNFCFEDCYWDQLSDNFISLFGIEGNFPLTFIYICWLIATPLRVNLSIMIKSVLLRVSYKSLSRGWTKLLHISPLLFYIK